ncbi:hypothetical protein [Paenibacillus vini]|uniref:Adenosine deaminase family protein n=1 Tax=Paenibacillus vini TaxID=1476024 RepID=A0ABQ4M951_9BACL|nr:hypothetical protein [Paenibacillus vini]GIP52518.1 adenosine deaminase family protein [Paenibacillus vini]
MSLHFEESAIKRNFIDSLVDGSLKGLQAIPKSDLHNHAGRGGNIKYISEWANVGIQPPTEPFQSLHDMQSWFDEHVKRHCSGMQGYLKRIEASFVQAAEDHIEILALSFGLDEIDNLGGMDSFSRIMDDFHRRYAPQTKFLPELALDRACHVEEVLGRLDAVLACQWFRSTDICGDEFAQPIACFKSIYRAAKAAGLTLKAHVGEFGTADHVMEAVEELELQEVHHGIAAVSSPQIMSWLSRNQIQLNVCPTSNIMLGVAESYGTHPIRKLYEHGIPVTINTDDLLIFNQSVSQEYMNLYKSGLMTPEELNEIRLTGLKR